MDALQLEIVSVYSKKNARGHMVQAALVARDARASSMVGWISNSDAILVSSSRFCTRRIGATKRMGFPTAWACMCTRTSSPRPALSITSTPESSRTTFCPASNKLIMVRENCVASSRKQMRPQHRTIPVPSCWLTSKDKRNACFAAQLPSFTDLTPLSHVTRKTCRLFQYSVADPDVPVNIG